MVLWIPRWPIKLSCCHLCFVLEKAAGQKKTKYLNAQVLQAASDGANIAKDVLKNPALVMRYKTKVCQSE